MPDKFRGNLLALAVMVCLYERPMHPYEIVLTLRQRHKEESVRLNYVSLYAVIASLLKRGLVAVVGVERQGRLPERTVYCLTDSGKEEVHQWMADLISTPTREYPSLAVALTFLPVLSPDEALRLLKERALSLETRLVQGQASLQWVQRHGLPRLLWIEAEFLLRLTEAELQYVRELIGEIEAGTLEGTDFWKALHESQELSLGIILSEKAQYPEETGIRAGGQGTAPRKRTRHG